MKKQDIVLKHNAKKEKKLEIFRREIFVPSMGTTPERAYTTVQTCCGTGCN